MSIFNFQARIDRNFFAALFLSLIAFTSNAFSDETVKIKILAVNPSTTQILKSTVSQYLPVEVGPDDILDKEGFEIKYDPEKRAYLIKKEVELKPKETQTIEIRVRNVWIISPEQIEEVKSQLKQNMDALATTKFSVTAKLLYEKANEVLAQIEENQTKNLGIMQRIDVYRVNIRQLDDLHQNALSLESMRRLEEEKKLGVREVKFMVTAQNPAAEKKTLTVRSELPRDIQAKDILEKGNFSVVFDEAKGNLALEMKDELEGKETKNYQIVLRDIWYIPQSELDFLKVETEKLIPLFESSPYQGFAVKQGDIILNSLKAIAVLQTEVSSSTVLQDRIRAHVLNEQREKFAKRKIKELQDLLSEVSLKPNEGDLASQLKQLVKKIAELKKLVIMAMGFQPKKAIVWIILLAIVGFLIAVTGIFYVVWSKKLQELNTPKSKGAAAPPPEPKKEAEAPKAAP